MSTAVLNVKIDEALKEKLRHYAEVNNENLSISTEKLLLIAFSAMKRREPPLMILIASIRKNPWLKH